MVLCGTLYGFLIHLRIYPIIYLLGILNYLFVNNYTREVGVKAVDDEEGHGVCYNKDIYDNDDTDTDDDKNNDHNYDDNNVIDNDNNFDDGVSRKKFKNDNCNKKNRKSETNGIYLKHQNENDNQYEKLLSMNIYERKNVKNGQLYGNRIHKTRNSTNVSVCEYKSTPLGRHHTMIEKCKSILVFLASSSVSFFILSWMSYMACGFDYLEHAIFYHLTRADHRHNFSPLFYGKAVYEIVDHAYTEFVCISQCACVCCGCGGNSVCVCLCVRVNQCVQLCVLVTILFI